MQSQISKGIATLISIAALVLIDGCASNGSLKPDSRRIEPEDIDVGAAIQTANRDAKWPMTDWWRAYSDPQLDAWIEAAKKSSPTLAVAQARVREAVSLAGVAHSTLAPQLNGNLSIERQHWADNVFYGPGPLADATTWNNVGTVGLTYHLDLWGKDKNSAERALDLAHATAADERAAQLELEANVARTYINLSMNYALLDIARSTLEQQHQIYDLASRRLKGGLGTQLELTQAETPLPEYEREIDALEEEVALGRNQLAALAGKGPGAGDSIMRPKLSLDTPAKLPSALPAELLGHRPDVVAARWTVAAQARGIDVAKANFYPDVNLLASFGGFAAAGPLFRFLRAANGGWTAGPALSLPIFDGGRLRSELGASDAGYDVAVEQYNQTIISALKDVSDQVVRMRSLQTQEADAERSVAIARKNYDLSKEGFRRGLTDYLNVLIAQNQLLRAQEGVARTQAQRLNAHASLMTALGGGLVESEDSPESNEMAPAHGRRRITPSSTSTGSPPVTPLNNTDSASAADPNKARE
ncbi:NodT family efflux transporter outer membrane factor (OMF) lipoprotein [Paraburkholderia sp. GAS199]|uniref:efflux transporter outer membrane subunit n=1 Tax=Paraburkholderia sp. GAS199 TaxID=3035126 RepID=UPI003D24BD07